MLASLYITKRDQHTMASLLPVVILECRLLPRFLPCRTRGPEGICQAQWVPQNNNALPSKLQYAWGWMSTALT